MMLMRKREPRNPVGKKPDLMTVQQVSAAKGVADNTTRRAIAQGALPAFKVAGVWMVRRRDCGNWTPRPVGRPLIDTEE